MEKSKLNRVHLGKWKRLAFVAVIATMAILTTQGCCSTSCKEYHKRVVTHTFVIAEDMDGCNDPAGSCVCFVPRDLMARAGDRVRIVNTTDYVATITWSGGGEKAFVEDDPTTEVDNKKAVTLTIVDEIPVGLSQGFGSGLTVASPGLVCQSLPGPGIDWDDWD